MLCRTRLIVVAFLLFLLILGFFTGCDERQRGHIRIGPIDEVVFHNVLTLLFDGVPPLDNGPLEAGTGETDPNGPVVSGRPAPEWYIHKPLKDCVRCHGNRQQESFSREVQLIAPMPELCYACHTAFAPKASKGWVHGPVAVGQCLVCHEPHKTVQPHLLKMQIPGLCYGCHQDIAGELAAEVANRPHSECLRCHAAHVNSMGSAIDRMPELCYECHASLAPTALHGWAHGPVAVGQCQLCHQLHGTGNPHLLKAPPPGLCYACHQEAAVKAIREHETEAYANCNNCHEGHVSSERSLLKSNRQPVSTDVETAEHLSGPSGQ